jgi:hypothetical protein
MKQARSLLQRRRLSQQTFSLRQAGELMGKSAEAVRKYIQRGKLKIAKRDGKLIFVSRAEIERFTGSEIRSRRQEPHPSDV